MYIKKRYSFIDLVKWTRNDTLVFFIIGATPVLLYQVFNLKWLQVPWTPVAIIGTAVAFVVGFQNNAAYERIWEARKIWGGIVNYSRSWTMMVQSVVTSEHVKGEISEKELQEHIKVLVYRHVAWLTALRHAMRQSRPWEVLHQQKTMKKWLEVVNIPEWKSNVEEDLKPYLSESEHVSVLKINNKANAVLDLQSKHLRELKELGVIWEFSFLELQNILVELFNLQGKSERIKNFPYPRQYATINHYFIWTFILLLPFAMIPEFAAIGAKISPEFPIVGNYFHWFSVPFSMIISWIFHTMERIGRVGENPFEGTANDVPISTISRGIEIDIRQMIGEDSKLIPEPFEVKFNAQM